MDVKETGYLKVLADFSFPENQIVINPNDGFDLGLLTSDTTAVFYYGESPATIDGSETRPIHGTIRQKNECAMGNVEISRKAVEKMGTPPRIRLHLVQQSPYPHLLISTV
ncbi:hypothetical protein [Alkalispirochaeta alkalica]|uniref:hypothetical protein n=1 Tax=Alkalispirochaeta alkalica TaxID=46356 RepID=UPI0003656D74|nr:hypothetical protein [Alkalispirochaeta alkalica]